MRTLVLIADRPAVVRAIRLALRSAAGFRVVAVADGRAPAGAAVREHAPDVVLVDEMCQRANALARVRESREGAPAACVVMLSTGLDEGVLDDAFAAGADSVLSRRLRPGPLGNALRSVVDGTVVNRPGEAATAGMDPLVSEILRLVAGGMAVERAAEVLALPRQAVEAHLQAGVRALARGERLRPAAHAMAGPARALRRA